jgi:hypothetical protein
MTTPQGQPTPFAAGALLGARYGDRADDTNTSDQEIVGASDAEADAARAGAEDADLDHAQRDSDGVPVGRADRDEDIRRSREG